ncbi:MAG: dTDP-4-dehydrorhamnose 3,5-epimerase [Candidatus Electryonea clarkiae]|nr:dTDP-4-dehydrorhamnose 3,5-epimerase [Candidatus Electryonea clarkiae]MDP8285906.1 dTDP-4-dehydrorhamnose 3,5-epimerase [Candidatus Electryonea clarkiae]
MEFIKTSIEGMFVVVPQVFSDERGFFMETYHVGKFAANGIDLSFVQDNHSHSTSGVLRGLHYQLHHPQGKLIRVMHGEVFDVGVDIRKGSPTFGKWHGEILSGENKLMLYLPPGIAHGFCVLSEEVDFLYKCTDLYSPEDDRGLIWNDPSIGIDWRITNPILSKKDQQNPGLGEIELPSYMQT